MKKTFSEQIREIKPSLVDEAKKRLLEAKSKIEPEIKSELYWNEKYKQWVEKPLKLKH